MAGLAATSVGGEPLRRAGALAASRRALRRRAAGRGAAARPSRTASSGSRPRPPSSPRRRSRRWRRRSSRRPRAAPGSARARRRTARPSTSGMRRSVTTTSKRERVESDERLATAGRRARPRGRRARASRATQLPELRLVVHDEDARHGVTPTPSPTAGSRTSNAAPGRGLGTSRSSPPCRSTIRREMASPRPVPSCRPGRERLEEALARAPDAIPRPVVPDLDGARAPSSRGARTSTRARAAPAPRSRSRFDEHLPQPRGVDARTEQRRAPRAGRRRRG